MTDSIQLIPLQSPYFDQFYSLIEHPNFATQVLHVERTAFRYFQCTQCGDCCTSAWRIHLPEAYYKKWYAFFDEDPSGRFRQPFVTHPSPTAEQYADIRRLTNHRCIFLEPDNSCYIHRHHGEEALSEICRSYPRGHKRVQNLFSTRVLLESCEAVPDVLAAHKGLFYAWVKAAPYYHIDSHNFNVPDHLPAYQNFLWLGLAFDLLLASSPGSVFQRWLFFEAVLKENLPQQVSETRLAHWQQIQRHIQARLPLHFPVPPLAEDIHRALKWMMRVMPLPQCTSWLKTLLDQELSLPDLASAEQNVLNDYLQTYLENRLLGICYGDIFWGEANFWEQNLMLVLSAVAVQTLARYYAHQSQSPLQAHHLQRASVLWTKEAEQRRELLTNLSVKGVSSAATSQAIRTLLSLTPLQ